MVGVPVGSDPTSLTEIAEACHDYSKPNNLNSFRYVYMTDGSRAGTASGTGDLKYSQFIGKNVAYNVTGTGLLATGTEDQAFTSWSSFAASRGLEYFMLASPNNQHCEPRAFTTTGSTHATLTWSQPSGTSQSQYRLEDRAHAMAISRSGVMVIGSEEVGSTVSSSPRNAMFVHTDATNFSSGYWSPGYDGTTGFGTKIGHLVQSGNDLYIPTRAGLYGGYQMVTILKIDMSSSPHSWLYGWSSVFHYGHSIQLSENLDRLIIDNGPGASVRVYTTNGSNISEEQALTTTGATGHVYCNSDCSVIVSGNNIWHRSGTTWTAANTDEITNRNVDARTCDISDDGTIVVYKRDGISSDSGGADQLNHFHYHNTNNRWYYTGNSNLGTTGENNRFLGGGFSSTNIGVRNDGLVIGKWDSFANSGNNQPKAYKGTIGVKK